MSNIALVNLTLEGNVTVIGVYDYDRPNGGIFLPPRGTSFPLSPTTDEIFYRTDQDTIYRWDGAAWQQINASVNPATIDHNSLQNLTVGDPHTQYQLESEKASANGYASLDGNTVVVQAIQVIRETSGPNNLTVDGIADGEFLQRSGTSITGSTPTQLTSTNPVNVNRAAAQVGTSTEAARQDHKHDVDVAAPVTIGSSNSEGTSSSLSRADHVHDHGDQAGGTLHASASISTAGFMSAVDKTKLNNLDFGIVAQGFDDPIDTIVGTTAFQNKVTVGPVSLPAGNYLIEWSYGWNHDSQASDFEGRLLQNGVPLGELHKQEPKDSAGGDPTGTTQRFYNCRRRIETLPAASYTWILQYRTDNSSNESSIWEALVTVTRLS